jgi:hypothetical protein
MNLRRWNQVWKFLSLDMAEQCRDELLLGSTIDAVRKAAIRSRLEQGVLEQEPAGSGVVTLFKVVDPRLSVDAEAVFLWGEHIFLYQGPDRTAETVWRLTSYWLQNRRIPTAQDWVYEVMASLRMDQNARALQFTRASCTTTSASGWACSPSGSTKCCRIPYKQSRLPAGS